MTLPIGDLSIFVSTRNSRLLGATALPARMRSAPVETFRQLWRQRFQLADVWPVRCGFHGQGAPQKNERP